MLSSTSFSQIVVMKVVQQLGQMGLPLSESDLRDDFCLGLASFEDD